MSTLALVELMEGLVEVVEAVEAVLHPSVSKRLDWVNLLRTWLPLVAPKSFGHLDPTCFAILGNGVLNIKKPALSVKLKQMQTHKIQNKSSWVYHV